MAIPHAQPGEVVDVRPLGAALAETKTRTLFKTENVEAVRIVMKSGKEISEQRIGLRRRRQCGGIRSS